MIEPSQIDMERLLEVAKAKRPDLKAAGRNLAASDRISVEREIGAAKSYDRGFYRA